MGRSCRASKQGIEKAERAFKLKGWTQEYLAGVIGRKRQTIINFFARRTVDKSVFQAICTELDLEWGEIAELEEGEEQAGKYEMDVAQQNTSESYQQSSSITKQQTTRKAIFILSGTIDTVNKAKLKAIEEHLRKISGDANLTFTDVEEGSIKITLEGSDDGIERLWELFESGELTEVLGIPVEDIQLLSDGLTQEDNEKSRLIREIVTQGASGRDLIAVSLSGANLSGADLSSADLSGADLSGANLSGAILRGADLSDADLSDADLSGANLSGADLRNADLRNADLRNADLSDADLSDAIVVDALFGGNAGLTQEMILDLVRRRAIFGDRPPVPSLK
jgi:uncharacterized protein YjbI with pentapeptide repeats/transcriptional regulator with XRE-family HTH domain